MSFNRFVGNGKLFNQVKHGFNYLGKWEVSCKREWTEQKT